MKATYRSRCSSETSLYIIAKLADISLEYAASSVARCGSNAAMTSAVAKLGAGGTATARDALRLPGAGLRVGNRKCLHDPGLNLRFYATELLPHAALTHQFFGNVSPALRR